MCIQLARQRAVCRLCSTAPSWETHTDGTYWPSVTWNGFSPTLCGVRTELNLRFDSLVMCCLDCFMPATPQSCLQQILSVHLPASRKCKMWNIKSVSSLYDTQSMCTIWLTACESYLARSFIGHTSRRWASFVLVCNQWTLNSQLTSLILSSSSHTTWQFTFAKLLSDKNPS